METNFFFSACERAFTIRFSLVVMGSRSVIVFVVVALGVLVAAQAPTNVEQGL